jgi:hypothetical protein
MPDRRLRRAGRGTSRAASVQTAFDDRTRPLPDGRGRDGRREPSRGSQLPIDRWHEIIGDPTYADAILDHLVNNAHRVELAGESMRRTRGKQNQKA